MQMNFNQEKKQIYISKKMAELFGVTIHVDEETENYYVDTIANKIFSYLDPSTLRQAIQVSHAWRKTIFKPFHQTFESLQAVNVRIKMNEKLAHKRSPIKSFSAVYYNEKEYTYEEINHKANQLAHYLLSLKLPKESWIGLFFTQSLEYIVSLLACMKAGLPFMPITADYDQLPERTIQFLNNEKIECIITTPALKEKFAVVLTTLAKKIFMFDQQESLLTAHSVTNPNIDVKPQDLAYILATSGSTGIPKKVLIEYHGLNFFMLSHHEQLKITPHDKIAAFTDISFDAHLCEVMLALGKGATLVIIPTVIRKDYNRLKHFLRNSGITVAVFTPSMLRELNPADFPNIRVLISTGEKVDEKIVKQWCLEGRDENYPRLFINGYGPSEATIGTTLAICNPGEEIHIGRPMPGWEVFILEQEPKNKDAPQFVADGQEGEIYIGGFGVGRGYTDANLTKERFRIIQHPGDPKRKIRVFQTRDAGRISKNGQIEILGRLDRQLKIHGKLFCPEEMEAVIHNCEKESHDNIKGIYIDAAIAHKNYPQLIAYVMLYDNNKIPDFRYFYRHISAKLSYGIAPTCWKLVETIPLTVNNKLDNTKIKKLPATNYYVRGYSSEGINLTDTIGNKIAKLWHTTLELPENFNFLYDDDFLMLGASSLQVSHLLLGLEKTYGIKIKYEDFLQDPTIGFLIRQAKRQDKSNQWHVEEHYPMKPFNVLTPSRKTIFLIHSLMGDSQADYSKLMKFQFDFNIYALSSRGYSNEADMDENLHTIAQDIIHTIKTVQPDGPYFIAGWSAGGILALVVQNILTCIHKETAFIMMFDSLSITHYQNYNSKEFAEYLKDLCQSKLSNIIDLKAVFKTSDQKSFGLEHSEFTMLDEEKFKQFSKEKQIYELFKTIRYHLKQKYKDEPDRVSLGKLATIQGILLGILKYRLRPAKQIALVTALQSVKNAKSERLNWPDFIEFDSILCQEGDHESIMLDPPKAIKTAALMSAYFKEKQEKYFLEQATRKINVETQTRLKEIKDRYVELENTPYVSLQATLYENVNDKESLENLTNNFLISQKKILLLAGDPGCGASTFCRHYLAKKMNDNALEHIILYFDLIHLNENNKANFIEKSLLELLGKGHIDEEVKVVRTKKPFLIILDNYHDISPKFSGNLYLLNQLDNWHPDTKVIMTSRNPHFAYGKKDFFYVNLGNKDLLQVALIQPLSEESKSKLADQYGWNKERLNCIPFYRHISNPLILKVFFMVIKKIDLSNIDEILKKIVETYFDLQQQRLQRCVNFSGNINSISENLFTFMINFTMKEAWKFTELKTIFRNFEPELVLQLCPIRQNIRYSQFEFIDVIFQTYFKNVNLFKNPIEKAEQLAHVVPPKEVQVNNNSNSQMPLSSNSQSMFAPAPQQQTQGNFKITNIRSKKGNVVIKDESGESSRDVEIKGVEAAKKATTFIPKPTGDVNIDDYNGDEDASVTFGPRTK